MRGGVRMRRQGEMLGGEDEGREGKGRQGEVV